MDVDFIIEIEEEEVTTPNRPYQKEYGRSLKRKRDWKKARRKEKIYREIYYIKDIDKFMPPRHWFSKNKIHCSCPMCRDKRKDGYMPIYEKKLNDKMDYMIAELRFIKEEDD